MLNIQFLHDVNFLHVLVAGLVYWIVGALWYMAIFSKPWAAGIAKWGLPMGQKPDGATMMKKMVLSFLVNLTGAFIIAWFVHNETGYNAMVGAKIGFTGGILAVAAFSTQDVWLSKPLTTWLVDATFHIVGLTVVGAILGCWH